MDRSEFDHSDSEEYVQAHLRMLASIGPWWRWETMGRQVVDRLRLDPEYRRDIRDQLYDEAFGTYGSKKIRYPLTAAGVARARKVLACNARISFGDLARRAKLNSEALEAACPGLRKDRSLPSERFLYCLARFERENDLRPARYNRHRPNPRDKWKATIRTWQKEEPEG